MPHLRVNEGKQKRYELIFLINLNKKYYVFSPIAYIASILQVFHINPSSSYLIPGNQTINIAPQFRLVLLYFYSNSARKVNTV